MNNEIFNPFELLRTRLRYPFPTLKNPHADQLQKITETEWIDGEYRRLYQNNPDLRKKCRNTETFHIAAQWCVTASAERFRFICRPIRQLHMIIITELLGTCFTGLRKAQDLVGYID